MQDLRPRGPLGTISYGQGPFSAYVLLTSSGSCLGPACLSFCPEASLPLRGLGVLALTSGGPKAPFRVPSRPALTYLLGKDPQE